MAEFNLQKHSVIILIIGLVILGFFLRSYHMSYPVIGYHNWKEVHYLSEARNFARDGFFSNGFFVPEFDYPALNSEGESSAGAHPDTFPLPQIILAVLFRIFGESVAIARLLSILASIASIPLAFLIGKMLFHRSVWGFLLASLLTINPLSVFFGRNFQLDSFGLFLSLLSVYYFMKWYGDKNFRNFSLSVLFLSLATVTKYTFLIFIIPILFSFPWREEFRNWKKFVIPSLSSLIVPLWIFYEQVILQSRLAGGIGKDFSYDLGVLFSDDFRAVMKSYIADNYTTVGWYVALIGIFLFAINFYFSKNKSWQSKYLLGCAVSLPVFLVIGVNKLSGHSYHQYPVLFFILLFISYVAVVVCETLFSLPIFASASSGSDDSSNLFRNGLRVIFVVIMIFLLWSPSIQAKNRMFDTQFPGLEVAGEYVKTNSDASDFVLFPSGQSYGFLWHSDRKGFKTPGDISGFKKAELKGANWLYVYQWGFSITQNSEVWDYVKQNYHLEQATFQVVNNQPQIISLLLKRGGNYTDADLNLLAQSRTPSESSYEYSGGVQKLFTVSAN